MGTTDSDNPYDAETDVDLDLDPDEAQKKINYENRSALCEFEMFKDFFFLQNQ